jgi:hypothetical protein
MVRRGEVDAHSSGARREQKDIDRLVARKLVDDALPFVDLGLAREAAILDAQMLERHDDDVEHRDELRKDDGSLALCAHVVDDALHRHDLARVEPQLARQIEGTTALCTHGSARTARLPSPPPAPSASGANSPGEAGPRRWSG